jgi:hypothetical protein
MTIRQWLLGGMLLALAACADSGTGPGAPDDDDDDTSLMDSFGLEWHFMPGVGWPVYDVWGRSETDVFAVSVEWDEGFGSEVEPTILHFDGIGWSRMPLPGAVELRGVWGSSGGDVFAVGDGIHRYDGEQWSRMGGPDSPIPRLVAVWGSSATDVFTVGEYGIILHYDGLGWSLMREESQRLTDVWGTSPTDVFAVGDGILHYDGSGWSPMSAPSAGELNGVWGSASDDVYAVGVDGVILHYDGVDWSLINAPETIGDLFGVWGTSSTDVFAVGVRTGSIGRSEAVHYDGVTWTVRSGMCREALFDVWAAPDQVFFVGAGPVLQGVR